jgi:hypothetical protein
VRALLIVTTIIVLSGCNKADKHMQEGNHLINQYNKHSECSYLESALHEFNLASLYDHPNANNAILSAAKLIESDEVCTYVHSLTIKPKTQKNINGIVMVIFKQ